ncbi:MAG: M20/M25/M40 family metallo-hydrolase [Planctomycetota bacterium]|nr:M20/M25/M40 family metallo-hydrolase [Planctomycetota bacterium]
MIATSLVALLGALQPALSLDSLLAEQDSRPATSRAARVDAAIGADELEAHLAYLASDELEGRFTGSPGAALAADYLAARLSELESYGLQPAGDQGTYLQDIRLEAVTFDELPVMRAGDREVTYGADFELRAGHGFTGQLKVLVIEALEDLPAEAQGDTALYLNMSRSERTDALAARSDEWQRGWGAIVRRGLSKSRKSVADPNRIRRIRANGDPVTLEVHGDLRDAFDAGEVETLDLAVGGTVKQAFNVVALLPGKGRSALPQGPVGPGAPSDSMVNEAIVVSAHYDHLRPRAPREGEVDPDLIYNGADDDASGVAAVLEIIEAICLADERPDRDVVVLLATGEEIGLIGTSFYLDHPVVPLTRTVANLNFEMLGRPDELVGGPGKIWFTGFEHTNLGAAYQAAGLDIYRDPRPTQHFFERSDNYAFVLKGIVGQSFSSYNLHEEYHTVDDELETIDFEHLAATSRACAQALAMTLAGDFAIEWSESYELPRR